MKFFTYDTAISRHKEYLSGAFLLVGLYMIGIHNYLLFHSLAELFSIVVACGLFLFAWNNRHLLEDDYYLLLGTAYLCISGLDLLHTLSYKGMGVFTVQDANLPTQLWIASRYLESLTLIIAPWLTLRHRRRPAYRILVWYLSIFSLSVFIIFRTDLFPLCYIEGQGLTPFKIFSEFVICGLLGGAILVMQHYRSHFAPRMFRWLMVSIFCSIASEMAFTLYTDVYGIMNLLGHYGKLLSFYLIYKAMIETSLNQPYQSIFRDLHASERRFHSYFDLPLVGIAMLSLEGRWLELNQKFGELLGYSNEEFASLTWETLTAPEDWNSIEKTLFTDLAQGRQEQYDCEKRFCCKDGSLIDVRVSVGCVRDEKGKPAYLVALADDITIQKNMQRDKNLLIEELQDALLQIRHLHGLLPLCPNCRKVRNEDGYWQSVTEYLQSHGELDIEYTLCEECLQKKFPGVYEARRTLPQYRNFLSQVKQQIEKD